MTTPRRGASTKNRHSKNWVRFRKGEGFTKAGPVTTKRLDGSVTVEPPLSPREYVKVVYRKGAAQKRRPKH